LLKAADPDRTAATAQARHKQAYRRLTTETEQ